MPKYVIAGDARDIALMTAVRSVKTQFFLIYTALGVRYIYEVSRSFRYVHTILAKGLLLDPAIYTVNVQTKTVWQCTA